MQVDKWDYHRLFICAHAVGLNIDNFRNISRVFAQIVRVCYPIGRCLQIGVNSRFKKRFFVFVWITRAAVRMYILGRGGGKTPLPPPPTHTQNHHNQRERERDGGGGETQTDRQTDRQRQRD